MKTVGIVAEYNPFTNGHLYHMQQAREKTGADCVICVMSGNFVQRGDVAIFDKWTRAKAAVDAGVDLVIELPTAHALSSAEGFARGAVYLLNAIGAEYIAFGAEADRLDKLSEVADILSDEPEEFKQSLMSFLKKGLSYPTAVRRALDKITKAAHLLDEPNNTLAVEYLKAIRAFNARIEPVLIKRTGAMHDSDTVCDNIASASTVRKMIYENKDVSDLVPDCEYMKNPVFTDDFEAPLLYALRAATKEEIMSCPDVDISLAARIYKYKNEPEIKRCLHYIKSKWHTMSRVRRTLFHILLKNTIQRDLLPSYIRILAMNKTGAKHLSSIKKTCPLELINRLSRAKNTDDPHLLLDIFAASVYGIKNKERADVEYLKSPYVKK